jgi:type IV secretory pathway TrbD component
MHERSRRAVAPDRPACVGSRRRTVTRDGARLAGSALLLPPIIAAIMKRPVGLSLAHWIVIAFGLALYRIGARSDRLAQQRDDAERGRDAS